jgi:hypothetical protein
MRAVVAGIKYRSRDGTVHTSADTFRAIGSLTFEQLSSLRHRGAFTSVSLTFATCCQLSKYLDEPTGTTGQAEALLNQWYQVSTCRAARPKASLTNPRAR